MFVFLLYSCPPQTPSNLQPQIKIALPLLEVLGCRCYSQIGYEADDVMATLSKWARQRCATVEVATKQQYHFLSIKVTAENNDSHSIFVNML